MKQTIKNYLEREPYTHKGDYGKVLLAMGSSNMSGAAIMAAKAALRVGAGLVYVLAPLEIKKIVQIKVPEAIFIPLETWNRDLSPYDAMGLGCGISQQDYDKDLLAYLLSCPVPKVVDATGITLIAKFHLMDDVDDYTIMTPHEGEFKRILEAYDLAVKDLRGEGVKRYVDRFKGVLVLKGFHTSVTCAKATYENHTGNPGMATAGSGDVLSGVLVGLLGQNFSPFKAGSFGVYLHGVAGDIMAQKLTEQSLLATDIIDGIPSAIHMISSRLKGVGYDHKKRRSILRRPKPRSWV